MGCNYLERSDIMHYIKSCGFIAFKKINNEIFNLLNSDKFDDITSEFTVDFNPISFS